ncbi:MAG: hypothetical protein LBR54_03225 [Oscillospiraceae bacterium]|nr:hypothetical protein [Oscillospiraceae bacterium]
MRNAHDRGIRRAETVISDVFNGHTPKKVKPRKAIHGGYRDWYRPAPGNSTVVPKPPATQIPANTPVIHW